MSDRELLEAAAKAAGIVGKWGCEGYIEKAEGFIPKGWRRAWDPLNRDGDALRLAVKLKLWIAPCADGELIEVSTHDDAAFAAEVAAGRDPYAATRLAIVRAAAAIGEAMP